MRIRPTLKTLGLALLTAGAMNLQILYAQNTPVTTAEAEKLSMQLELSMNSGDPEILNHLIYFPAFIARTESKSPIIDNLDTLTKIANSFGLFSIGNSTLEITKNGSFKLVRGFLKNEEMHLLFRAFGDGGFNYQDITIIKVKDSIRAADIFSYELGESYARQFSYLITDTGTTDAHSSLTSRNKYGIIFENALSNKNYSVARSAFEKFDDQAQNDKYLSLQYMLACEHLSEKLFRKSADRYISLFPDEPTPYLLLMNEYAKTKSYGEYSKAIDKLDTLLHIDPFLNYFRGNVVMKLGDLRGALYFYQKAFDYDPGIWQNTEKLVACKVVNNELVQASEAIILYSHTPGYRKDLVESLYADYPALR
jgi:tetratricopeptide (TPR) repeat protein